MHFILFFTGCINKFWAGIQKKIDEKNLTKKFDQKNLTKEI